MSETQVKQILGFVLKIREDLIINSAFAQILTPHSLIEVKLPTKVENYRYRSVLNFGHVLALDLVKTRKHWIVTHIECKSKLDLSSWSYIKFEILTQMNSFLLQNLHLDQDCHIADVIQEFLQNLDTADSAIDLKELLLYSQNHIEHKLGFAIQKNNQTIPTVSTMKTQVVLP